MANNSVYEMEFEVLQGDDVETETAHAHGNFRVGEIKEAEIMEFVRVDDPDEIDNLIENFISSGKRIEIVATKMCLPMMRYLISSRLLYNSQFSSSNRRVIVRELDGVLYLARRAFWFGKRLPIEFADSLSIESELGMKVRQQNESVRENKKSLKHMSELTPEQLEEIADWEASENLKALVSMIESTNVIKITNL